MYKLTTYILLGVILAMTYAAFVSLYELSGYTLTRVCHSFSSHKDAQHSLAKWPSLDGNHDGIACNALK